MQVSLFLSVLINRFHCINNYIISIILVLKLNMFTKNHSMCTNNRIPHSCVMHICLLMCSKFICGIFACNMHIPFILWLACTIFVRNVTSYINNHLTNKLHDNLQLLSACSSQIEPFHDHMNIHVHLTRLKNKPQELNY